MLVETADVGDADRVGVVSPAVVGDVGEQLFLPYRSIFKYDVVVASFCLYFQLQEVGWLHSAIGAVGRAVDDDFMNFAHRLRVFFGRVRVHGRSC